MIANLVLVVGVALAVRSRRGGYSRRDVADGLTVLLGAMVVAWIAIANPLIERRGLGRQCDPQQSLAAALGDPRRVDRRPAGEWARAEPATVLLVVALSLNLVGDLMRGLIKSEVLDVGAADFVIAVYFGALFTAPWRSPIRRSGARSTSAHPVSRSTRPSGSRPRLLPARADRARCSGAG